MGRITFVPDRCVLEYDTAEDVIRLKYKEAGEWRTTVEVSARAGTVSVGLSHGATHARGGPDPIPWSQIHGAFWFETTVSWPTGTETILTGILGELQGGWTTLWPQHLCLTHIAVEDGRATISVFAIFDDETAVRVITTDLTRATASLGEGVEPPELREFYTRAAAGRRVVRLTYRVEVAAATGGTISFGVGGLMW